MSIEELRKLEDKFLPYNMEGSKMNICHNREAGEVVVIIYNPNILGITKLKDLLTLNAEGLRNLLFYYRTRNEIALERVLSISRQYKEPRSIVELMIEPQQVYNEVTMKVQSLIEQSK